MLLSYLSATNPGRHPWFEHGWIALEYQQRNDLIEYLNHSAMERSFELKEALTVNPHFARRSKASSHPGWATVKPIPFGKCLTKYRISSESVCAAMHNFAVLQ